MTLINATSKRHNDLESGIDYNDENRRNHQNEMIRISKHRVWLEIRQKKPYTDILKKLDLLSSSYGELLRNELNK